MAAAALASSIDMRLHAIDDPKKTEGPRWNDNSCSMDCCAWLAKTLGVWQVRCDHDSEPKNQLQLAFRKLMQNKWWKIGPRKVDEARSWLRTLYTTRSGEMSSVPMLWDSLTTALPSTSIILRGVDDCDTLDCHHEEKADETISTILLTGAVLHTRANAVKDDLSTLLTERLRRWYLGPSKRCTTCGTMKARHFLVVNELPPLLAVNIDSTAWQTVSTSPVTFTYYTYNSPTKDPVKLEATYRLRGGILYKAKHFEAFALWYGASEEVSHAVWYDGYVEAKDSTIRNMSKRKFDTKLQDYRRTGGEVTLLIFERLH